MFGIVLGGFLCTIGSPARAQESAAFVTKQFIIVKSTKNYAEAKAGATAAADTLKIPLDLRELQPHKQTGLTLPEKGCREHTGSFPCYIARGRWDNGYYASVEYSNAYEGFTKGYYVVMVGSRENDDEGVPSFFQNTVRRAYPDAYIKRAKIYMGDLH